MAGERLDSWKEIAAHLSRSVSTVQRWERQEGLPVHRHQHEKKGTVWAYRDEIDAWWETRGPEVESREGGSGRRLLAGRRAPWLALGAAGASILLISFSLFVGHDSVSPAERTMLAVLPFENLDGDETGDYLSSGLTEELITRLAQLDHERLGVIARTSSMQYQDSSKGIREIGLELGVSHILEGSLRGSEKRLRITAQLISVQDRTHVWAETYDRELADLLELESEISRRVAEALSIELLGERRGVEPKVPHPEAHVAYLRGRFFWNQRSREGLSRSIEELQRAIELDPSYARAYAGLADSYALLSITADAVEPREARERAVTAAKKALELDASLAEAHASLGVVYYRFDWDWEAAEAALERALELNPNYASAYQWSGVYLTEMGRFDEAKARIERALALDPLSPILYMSAGMPRQYDGHYDEALRFYELALELRPSFVLGHRMKGMTYLAMGRTDEALASLRRARELDSEDPHALAELGYAYAHAGRPRRTRELLTELTDLAERRHVTPYDFALLHVALNENQQALEWLERGYEVRAPGLVYLKVDPVWDSLRTEPRFRALVESIGLPG